LGKGGETEGLAGRKKFIKRDARERGETSLRASGELHFTGRRKLQQLKRMKAIRHHCPSNRENIGKKEGLQMKNKIQTPKVLRWTDREAGKPELWPQIQSNVGNKLWGVTCKKKLKY